MRFSEGGPLVDVWPVLANAVGDIPIMEKLMNSIGFSGYHACFRCALNGVWVPEAKSIRCVDGHCGSLDRVSE